MSGKKTRYLVLALAIGVTFALVGSAFAQEATYVGNGQCKICHNKKEEGEQWTKWKAMLHAKAFETLSTDAAKAAAQKKGVAKPPAEAPECLKCHVTAFDAAKGAAPEKIVKEDGIQCESCHGPASLHTADGKKFKSGDKTVVMSAHIVGKPDESVCKKCHNEESPTAKALDFKASSEKIAHSNPLKKK